MALSLPSLLGLLLLIGIVFANAILLVDFATKARDDYDDLDEAVVAAEWARLRPILMTALATIFALLPLALGLAGGEASSSPRASHSPSSGACDLDLSHVARRPGRLRPARRRPRSPEEEEVGVKQELRPGQGPPYFKLTAAGYYLSRPSPAGELSESLEKETECGRLAAGS